MYNGFQKIGTYRHQAPPTSYSGNVLKVFFEKGPNHPDTARALFRMTSSVGMVYLCKARSGQKKHGEPSSNSLLRSSSFQPLVNLQNTCSSCSKLRESFVIIQHLLDSTKLDLTHIFSSLSPCRAASAASWGCWDHATCAPQRRPPPLQCDHHRANCAGIGRCFPHPRRSCGHRSHQSPGDDHGNSQEAAGHPKCRLSAATKQQLHLLEN